MSTKSMKFFPFIRKIIPSPMSKKSGQVVNSGQDLVNVVKERPLSAEF